MCVYLSLHHIAALDAISARGSPTSSLQTTSDQNLDGGKGLGTRRGEDHWGGGGGGGGGICFKYHLTSHSEQ